MEYPLAAADKLIIVANVAKKLMEDSFKTDPGPDICRAALYLEKGVLCATRAIAPETVFQKPEGWKLQQLPPEWILIPAFIDCHVHLALDGINGFNNFTAPPPASAVQKNLQQAAGAGIFALRDGGDLYNTSFLAVKLRRELRGKVFLPKIIPTGQAVYRRGYYGSKLGAGITHPGEIDSYLQQLADNGAKQVKLILSGLVSLKKPWEIGPRQFSPPEIKTIVQKAGECGLPVMAHVNGAENVRLAIEAGVHTIEHGYYITRETLQLMARTGVAWVPTVSPLAAMLEGQNSHTQAGFRTKMPAAQIKGQVGEQAKRQAESQNMVIRQAIEHQLKMIAAAQELGVTLGLGTDTGAPGVGWGSGFQQEFKHYRKAGLSPLTVLHIATVNNAQLLGLSHKMGKIARGKKPCWLCLHQDVFQGEKGVEAVRVVCRGECKP